MHLVCSVTEWSFNMLGIYAPVDLPPLPWLCVVHYKSFHPQVCKMNAQSVLSCNIIYTIWLSFLHCEMGNPF